MIRSILFLRPDPLETKEGSAGCPGERRRVLTTLLHDCFDVDRASRLPPDRGNRHLTMKPIHPPAVTPPAKR
jgi:hypothetical protein